MPLGRDDKVAPIRITAVQYIILLIFLVLGSKFWHLQVVDSDKYASQAEQNRIRKVPILAPRGKILDREGRIIVDNYPSFSALLLRDQTHNIEADVDKIAAGLHMDPADIHTRIARFASMPQYQPIILKDDITPDELAFVESHRNELPELDTIMAHRRLYPKNGFMAHLIGYVGEVSEDMLNQPQWEFYSPGDVVGKSGVEMYYNDVLMGKDGSRREFVNSRGKVVDKVGEDPATPGKPLKLTIDLDLQIAAEQALGDKEGAIVAMNPKTGEVLAMVSRPTFDPNQFAVRLTKGYWNQLIKDNGKPLLNKAIQAQLAPGSTFKIIMATAGLQEGVAQTMKVHCSGGATFYGRRFGCWVPSGHGEVDITKAIYQSCDVFFYTLAERLGIGKIAKWATALGLGQRTGIDLPQEVSGVMPSEEWKLKNFKQKWFAGETISVGIGQGAVAATPVQMMRAIGGIAMDGKLVRPHVVDFDDLPGSSQSQYKQIASRTPDEVTVPIDSQNWETITDAMTRVTDPVGTAPSAHLEGVDFAGKTGSAQIVSLATRAKHTSNQEFAQNGWFVGFTPRRNPDVVVCVLFQGGEHGKLAARLAAQVIKEYVQKQRKVLNDVAYAAPPGYSRAALLKQRGDAAAPATTTPEVKPASLPDGSMAQPKNAAIPSEAADAEKPAQKSKKPAVKSPEEGTQSAPTPSAEPTGAQNHPPAAPSTFEMSGLWSESDGDGDQRLGGGNYKVQTSGKPMKPATAAPGMQ